MRITIHTLGSRGDVQPFIPLGLGLQRAGFSVRLASYEVFRPFIEEHGLEFYPIYGDPRDTMNSQAGQAWLRAGQNADAPEPTTPVSALDRPSQLWRSAPWPVAARPAWQDPSQRRFDLSVPFRPGLMTARL